LILKTRRKSVVSDRAFLLGTPALLHQTCKAIAPQAPASDHLVLLTGMDVVASVMLSTPWLALSEEERRFLC
jgi:hypothetical protein